MTVFLASGLLSVNTCMQNVVGKPSVFDFTDYRAFLKSFYDWQKTQGTFSHGIFAQRAGLKSRSFLRLVLTGKRNLSADGVAKFVKGLGLNQLEAEAFTALVNFTQASDHDSRKYYWELCLKLKPKSKTTQRVRDEYAFLARMGYPILLIVLRQPHVDHSLQSLASLTGLSEAQVLEGIEALVNLGAVKKNNGDSYAVVDASLCITTNLPNIAVHTFHKNMLKTAHEKIDLQPAERKFESVMMPLSEEEFLYVKQRLADLADELDQKFSGRRPKSKRVYAVNLNIIPVTPDFVRVPIKAASQKEEEVALSKESSL